jgi:hypothetical protein
MSKYGSGVRLVVVVLSESMRKLLVCLYFRRGGPEGVPRAAMRAMVSGGGKRLRRRRVRESRLGVVVVIVVMMAV